MEKCNPLKKVIQTLWILLKTELFFYHSGLRAEGIIHGAKHLCAGFIYLLPKCVSLADPVCLNVSLCTTLFP